MATNSWQHPGPRLDAVQVTEAQVRQARSIIESMMPGQAANMDAVLLAGVAHALAMKQQERSPRHH